MGAVVTRAQKLASEAGDQFVTTDRLLQAVIESKNAPAGKAFRDAGADAVKMAAAIESVRKGKTAQSAGAEDGFEALDKFTRDLTADAAEGRLDPRDWARRRNPPAPFKSSLAGPRIIP